MSNSLYPHTFELDTPVAKKAARRAGIPFRSITKTRIRLTFQDAQQARNFWHASVEVDQESSEPVTFQRSFC